MRVRQWPFIPTINSWWTDGRQDRSGRATLRAMERTSGEFVWARIIDIGLGVSIIKVKAHVPFSMVQERGMTLQDWCGMDWQTRGPKRVVQRPSPRPQSRLIIRRGLPPLLGIDGSLGMQLSGVLMTLPRTRLHRLGLLGRRLPRLAINHTSYGETIKPRGAGHAGPRRRGL